MVDALEATLGGALVEAAEQVEALPPAEKRSRRGLWIALGVAAALLLVVIAFFLIRSLTQQPAISLSQTTVRPGDNVAVKGHNLPANQRGTIQIESTARQLGEFQADGKGSFETIVAVPTDVTAGTHLIKACWNGSCPAADTVTVAPNPSPSPSPTATATPTPTPTAPPTPPPTPVFNPSIRVDTGNNNFRVQPDQNVTITGNGFDPSRQYELRLIHVSGQQWQLQPPSTPGGGSFVARVKIPAEAPPGGADIQACISGGGPCVRQPVTIVSRTSP